MNKIYEFTLHPSGYDPNSPRFYVIGAGTLEDGIAIIKDMTEQFVAWCDNPDMEQMFKLRVPSDVTPIWLWEGSDIMASGGPFGEQYGKELFENYSLSNTSDEWEAQTDVV